MWNILKQVANIRTGYTFRGKITETVDGNAHILQIKDLRRQYSELRMSELNAETLPKILWHGNQSTLLKSNSIVIPSRGEHYNAILFNQKIDVVPTSQTLVITVKTSGILPGFICWTINQRETQQYLHCESRGSSIPLLSKSSLELLPIQVPPLSIQNKILNLHNLWEDEEKTHRELLKNREHQLEGICQALLNKCEAKP